MDLSLSCPVSRIQAAREKVLSLIVPMVVLNAIKPAVMYGSVLLIGESVDPMVLPMVQPSSNPHIPCCLGIGVLASSLSYRSKTAGHGLDGGDAFFLVYRELGSVYRQPGIGIQIDVNTLLQPQRQPGARHSRSRHLVAFVSICAVSLADMSVFQRWDVLWHRDAGNGMVGERSGGPSGIRTRGLCLAKAAIFRTDLLARLEGSRWIQDITVFILFGPGVVQMPH